MGEKGQFPWSRPDALVQLGILLGVAAYAGVAIAVVFWPLGILYVGSWAAFVVFNHYYVCRDCQYCGTLCGSFGLGRLALYKRTSKEHFDPKRAHRSMIVLGATAIFPIPVLLFLSPFWLWDGVYAAGVVVFTVVHRTLGCAKCPLLHCPSNPNRKNLHTGSWAGAQVP